MKEIKARFKKDGNVKLGKMWTFSKLMSDEYFKTAYGIVKGSCGDYCVGCKNSCYVKKSYIRWTDENGNNQVINCHARNTLAIRNDIAKAFNDLHMQLKRARNKAEIVRIHQSGEIETPFELFQWVQLAKKHPETVFYTYTKNIDALRVLKKSIENGYEMPTNFTLNMSIWHEYLLKEYLEEFARYDFIKAFVYDDRAYNYAENGLEIETYCMAYDQNGKMNHAITCDKCRKCIKSNYKVIGCFDH